LPSPLKSSPKGKLGTAEGATTAVGEDAGGKPVGGDDDELDDDAAAAGTAAAISVTFVAMVIIMFWRAVIRTSWSVAACRWESTNVSILPLTKSISFTSLS